jgi:hypothetical protein
MSPIGLKNFGASKRINLEHKETKNQNLFLIVGENEYFPFL